MKRRNKAEYRGLLRYIRDGTTVAELIVALLKDGKARTTSQISQELDLGIGTVYNTLNHRKWKRLFSSSQGKYSLA